MHGSRAQGGGGAAAPVVESPERALPGWKTHLVTRLDQLVKGLSQDSVPEFVKTIFDELSKMRTALEPDAFQKQAVPIVREHAIRAIIHQDPFSSHSYNQPRGYPGDADLLDLIYKHPSAQSAYADATPLGRAISDAILEVSACVAVRERRQILARRIDEVSSISSAAEILSLACGHLREGEISQAVKDGQLKRFIAGDQDERSLAVVSENSGKLCSSVEARKVRVRDVLSGASAELGHFDLIYAAGLYDYLNDDLSAALTARLFGHLKSGGTLLIGNYLPGMWEVAYMETFMAWSLIYRDPDQIKAFSASIEPTQIAASRYFGDQSGCVGYLELVRA